MVQFSTWKNRLWKTIITSKYASKQVDLKSVQSDRLFQNVLVSCDSFYRCKYSIPYTIVSPVNEITYKIDSIDAEWINRIYT